MLKMLLAFTCLTLSIGANAAPVTWTFHDVVYADKSTTVGSFTFDADLGVNGEYTSFNFTTTCGALCVGNLSDTVFVIGSHDRLLTNNIDDVATVFYNDFYWASPLTNGGGVIEVLPIDSLIANQVYTEYTQVEGGYISSVPIPAAAWLFGSALLGLGALKRKKA
jgi:hypothetical protein